MSSEVVAATAPAAGQHDRGDGCRDKPHGIMIGR